MNNFKYYIIKFLTNETTLGAAALIGFVVFAASVNADWTVEQVEDIKVATLHGSVNAGDDNVPQADHYHINSSGGLVTVGWTISEKLQKLNKPVTFNKAYSIAALIAMETKAGPVGDNPTLGFHWTYSLDGKDHGDLSEMINTRYVKAIADRIPMRTYTKIMAQMDRLWGTDMAKSMVFYDLEELKVYTVLNGKIQ